MTRDQSARPPGPDTLPFIGAALPFFRRPFEYRTEVAATYGDVVDVSGLGRRIYLVSHPDDIERMLVSEADSYVKPAFEKRYLQRAFGESLSLAEGESWRRARRTCQPVFTVDRIERYGQTMARHASSLASSWADGATVDVAGEMRDLTFRIFMETMFGVDERDVPDLRADFEAVATKLRPHNAVVPDWIPTPTNRKYAAALDSLESTIDAMIDRRRRRADDADDLLSLLLAANEGSDAALSDERIRDEMLSFLFAGHETTAMTLTFAWYLLATHPSEREKLEREVDEVLDGDLPGVMDRSALVYADRVVDETLRLYPANHMIPREPTTKVRLGGYEIPAGVSVYCSQWIVHRDDRWWDAPDEFDPDRWLDDRDRPEYAYFPFGGGPRHCIGMRFARLELLLALTAITQQVSLSPSVPDQSPPSLAAGLSTHPKGPVELSVECQ